MSTTNTPIDKTMKNVSDTQAYTTFDYFFSKAIRSVSRLVSVKKLTQPFWGRWQASNIGDDILFSFLESIESLDEWPVAAEKTLDQAQAALAKKAASLDSDDLVREYRKISYLGNLAQWGILPINDEKKATYKICKDYYLKAEKLAFGPNFERRDLMWENQTYPVNLHLPEENSDDAKDGSVPLIIIVHGLDDCKEEHLMTELALSEAGFAVAGFDGPGQGEAFLLDGRTWTPDFADIVPALIDDLAQHPRIDIDGIGTVGFSIGSTWSLLAASKDPRIKAVYDLGAPIDTAAFKRVPFIIKSKMCQITGAQTQSEIRDVLSQNYINTDEILDRINAAVRIVHGLKDRVVSMDDKLWLEEALKKPGRARDVSLRTFEDGDHCCTNHIPEIRKDMSTFFSKFLING